MTVYVAIRYDEGEQNACVFAEFLAALAFVQTEYSVNRRRWFIVERSLII